MRRSSINSCKCARLRPWLTALLLAGALAIFTTVAYAATLTTVEERIDSLEASILSGSDTVEEAFRTRIAALRNELDQLRQGEPVPGAIERLDLRARRLGNQVEARRARPHAPFGLATSDSMSLVYPRELPCICTYGEAQLALAQGEYESLQAVVIAYDRPIEALKARVDKVVGPHGEPVTADTLQVTMHPVGSIFVRKSPHYMLPPGPNSPVDYEGWIPDPIRSDIEQVDVAAGDMQPFWVEVYAPSHAAPGTYRITLSFEADGFEPQDLEVEATVWPFTIDDRPHLETAISLTPVVLDNLYGYRTPEAREPMWQRYIDFLHNFKIEPDALYRSAPPTVEELLVRQEKWGLRQFNIHYIYPIRLFDLERPETWQASIDAVLEVIRRAMEQFEAAGLAEYAYVYGFDETRDEYNSVAKALFRQIKEEFPDLPIMTTLVDPSLGLQSGLAGLVDIWVPGVGMTNPGALKLAQATGDRVYWYTHVGIVPPLPNWFNGQEPIETRVLLGPLSDKMGVDGFLYYNIMRWSAQQGVMRDGLFSTWDGRTWGEAYGDGSLFYPGADGPLASQRIQNFRDGMEDYNLLVELDRRLEAAADVPEELVDEARLLLAAEEVAVDQRQFTRDPEVYRRWRQRVAEAIIALATYGAEHPAATQPVSSPTDPELQARWEVYQKAWIAYPRGFAAVSSPFDVRLHIAPDVEVDRWSLTIDGETISTGTERPIGSIGRLTLSDGTYRLFLEVVDKQGMVWRDTMSATVRSIDILEPQRNARIRGRVPLELAATAEAVLTDTRVTLMPVRDGEVRSGEAVLLIADPAVPTEPILDTYLVPDGTYQLSVTAMHADGRKAEHNILVIIDNWDERIDELKLPIDAGFFGKIDQKQTIFESDGWEYASSNKEQFFNDGDRRVWLGDGPGELIWEVENLRSVTFVVYATDPNVEWIAAHVSADGEEWSSLGLERKATDTNPSGWHQLELTAEVPAEPVRYLRMVTTEGAGPDSLQLGRVILRSPAGS